ncbi:dorsalin-1-like [Oratosquilla oratoria]|uniref:dorsalin-1-like n=1 Tax=Oratosquilla oratoria TaxID=337810 RepID=UPI003F764782
MTTASTTRALGFLLALLLVVLQQLVGVSTVPTEKLRGHDTKGPEQVSAELLEVLGLRWPGVRRGHATPPQYMLDLYTSLADHTGIMRSPSPYGSTVVRAFTEQESGGGSTFPFTLSGLSENEQVLEAEFHIYHYRLQKNFIPMVKSDGVYKIEVATTDNDATTVVALEDVAVRASGWRVFHLGSTLSSVLEKLGRTHGVINLTVSASTLDGRPLPLRLHHDTRGQRQPLLVLFGAEASNASSEVGNVHLAQGLNARESSHWYRVRRSVSDEDATDATPTDEASSAQAVRIPDGCERRDLTVNFESIGWSSWVLSPSEYNAFHCIGSCSFPLGQTQRPTNHATVQSLIHYMGNHPEVQRPCCVPATYNDLSLLYYDDNQNVVLKVYENMIAVECGCR